MFRQLCKFLNCETITTTIESFLHALIFLPRAGAEHDFWDNFKHAVRMFRMNQDSPSLPSPPWRWASVSIPPSSRSLDAVLLKPLTYPDADRICSVPAHLASEARALLPPSPNFTFGNNRPKSFRMSPLTTLAVPGSTLPGTGRSRYTVSTLRRLISISLAHRPILGRTFAAQEGSQNGGKVVVLQLWFVAAQIWLGTQT